MNKKYCVYRFLNKDNEIIYIGKAKNLESRISGHNHLPKKCYDEVRNIEYITLENSDEMSIYERYLINKCTPKYNTEYNNNSSFCFELPSKNWNLFSFKSTEKPIGIEHGKEFKILFKNSKLRMVSGEEYHSLNIGHKLEGFYSALKRYMNLDGSNLVNIPNVKTRTRLGEYFKISKNTIPDYLRILESEGLVKTIQCNREIEIYINPRYYKVNKKINLDTVNLFEK